MNVSDQHNKAMDLAEQALVLKRRGQEGSGPLFEQALKHELRAIRAFDRLGLAVEPTRSVLYRSAATLALDCGQLQKARDLVDEALQNNPPHEIAEELRAVLAQCGADKCFSDNAGKFILAYTGLKQEDLPKEAP